MNIKDIEKKQREIERKLNEFEVSDKDTKKQIKAVDKKADQSIEDIRKNIQRDEDLRGIIRQEMEDILGDLTAIREYNEDNIFT